MHDVSMARLTAWGVGGPADRVYVPDGADDLTAFLATLAPRDKVLFLGLGSNLLVRDGGLEEVVILTSHDRRGLGRIERADERRVRVGAGVPCAKLARRCAREGLAGGEFLAGIPGTMGGALAMNAGAHGGETWALVRGVETVDRAGGLHWRAPAEFDIGYRTVRGPVDEGFTAAELEFTPDAPERVRDETRRLLRERNASQPIGRRSCGSVFRNPPGEHAGRLIDQCGLKGTRVAGAVVSEKHANFIVNEGGASAADIEALIELVGERVFEATGIRMEPEVRVVGRPARSGEGKP